MFRRLILENLTPGIYSEAPIVRQKMFPHNKNMCGMMTQSCRSNSRTLSKLDWERHMSLNFGKDKKIKFCKMFLSAAHEIFKLLTHWSIDLNIYLVELVIATHILHDFSRKHTFRNRRIFWRSPVYSNSHRMVCSSVDNPIFDHSTDMYFGIYVNRLQTLRSDM